MDVNDLEASTSMPGGTDQLTVNNLAGTDLTEVNANLGSTIGGTTATPRPTS
jgi:hypothetical protein